MKQPFVRIFYSYDHDDRSYLNVLKKYLSVFRNNGLIRDWDDSDIVAGEGWASEIEKRLNESDMIILIVTANFLDSDYCFKKELQFALDKSKVSTLTIIPIIVENCPWEHTVLNGIQCVLHERKPISSCPQSDEAWNTVTNQIYRACQESLELKKEKIENKLSDTEDISERAKQALELLNNKIQELKDESTSQHTELANWLSENSESLTDRITTKVVKDFDKNSRYTLSELQVQDLKYDLKDLFEIIDVCLRFEDSNLIENPGHVASQEIAIYSNAFDLLAQRIPANTSEVSKSRLNYICSELATKI